MKILYWIATLVLVGIMLFSAQMYFFQTSMVEGFFESFGYPSYLVIPLAIVKVLGVIVIVFPKVRWLTEWAYAGFFFDLGLATVAHLKAGHTPTLSVLALIALIISYILSKKVRS